jgi:hypothetical protein
MRAPRSSLFGDNWEFRRSRLEDKTPEEDSSPGAIVPDINNPPYILGTTAMFCGSLIAYGDPGASPTPVAVTEKTNSFPAVRLIA